MSVKVCLIVVMLWATGLQAQGFAGLGGTAQGFALPQRGPGFAFPADHGPHPGFRIEWWYLTGNLIDEQNRPYGFQWTLFRSALRPTDTQGWHSPQIWMGHSALTTPTEHFFAERLSRGGIGTAGVVADPFQAWIDDWHMTSLGGPDALDQMRVTARGIDFTYDLTLEASGPLVLHGENGFSVKSADGRASHYYSQPFYKISGQIQTNSGPQQVSGTAWLDREWSSQPLQESQTGWDWVALTFSDGTRLMAAQLRDDGPGYRIGTWIDAKGQPTALSDTDLTLTPVSLAQAGPATVPVRWRITVPSKAIDVTIDALNPQAWMATSTAYWEGPVRVSGSHDGVGYLEMTGYDATAGH